MKSERPFSHELTSRQRDSYISGYSKMIEGDKDGRVLHHINFMFNSIPGGLKSKLEVMNRDVTRVHGLLTRSVVRKPDSPNWINSRPIFIGTPDLPVIKREKQDVRNFMVNEGWHFNVISLTPAIFGNARPLTHLFIPRSRMKLPLEEHFRREQKMYRTEYLYRVHATPITDGTMADYTLKTFRNGYVTPDEILVLK